MKKVIIAIALITLIFLVSCTTQRGDRDASPRRTDFHIGTQGVVMNFLKNSPPSRIFAGDLLEIVVELFNKGAYPEADQFSGYLSIGGFDKRVLKGFGWDGGDAETIDVESDFQGISERNPIGGYQTKTYRVTADVPFDSDAYRPTILVTSCYEYKTTANPVVCIDPDPFDRTGEREVCLVRDVGVGGGQGAPIGVTRVEEDVTSDKYFFRIFVKNVGDGRVFTVDDVRSRLCPSSLPVEDMNKVIAAVKMTGFQSPECTPRGDLSDPIRLVEGSGVITCSFRKQETGPAYTTALQIELLYGYTSTISKQIEIININKNTRR